MAALQAVSSSLEHQDEAAAACRCYRGCAGLKMTSPLTYSAAHTEDIHLVTICTHLLLLCDFAGTRDLRCCFVCRLWTTSVSSMEQRQCMQQGTALAP